MAKLNRYHVIDSWVKFWKEKLIILFFFLILCYFQTRRLSCWSSSHGVWHPNDAIGLSNPSSSWPIATAVHAIVFVSIGSRLKPGSTSTSRYCAALWARSEPIPGNESSSVSKWIILLGTTQPGFRMFCNCVSWLTFKII